MAGDEQRRDRRIPLTVECQVGEVSGHGSMRLRDLSLSGCYVDTSIVVPFGSAVTISVTLQAVPVVLSGRVVHRHPRVGFGVRFESLPQDATEAIGRFIATTSN